MERERRIQRESIHASTSETDRVIAPAYVVYIHMYHGY